MNQFQTIEGETFRQVLGHLPTGVTIITANGGADRVGMAANSVTSVSIEPPLILFCPARSSTTWPLIREAGRFCVNVLASHHAELSVLFSRRGVDRFKDVPFKDRWAGPVLDDAVAWLGCELYDEHEAGDHTIVVARVRELEAARDQTPLVFFQGRYGTVGF
jgi:flavin reductase (DIM6/NTAB) family NADH-FMN oxidoreductase RutF